MEFRNFAIMVTYTSRSPGETEDFGAQLGREARPGWVIGLIGDLGAGKTRLVQGIARGLGLATRLPSPTFALVNEYAEGRIPLAHLDLYRLDTTEQILAAGLEDYFYPREGVSVIEWFDRWTGPTPPNLVLLRLRSTTESVRVIEYAPPRP